MKRITKTLIIAVFCFWGIAPRLHAGDVNSSGTPHPHGITSSGLGTTVTNEGKTFGITGGTQKGPNLFHSFGKFNVHSGERAVFYDTGIQNTVGRITGGDYSWINGNITSAAENLYLMNPSGILFGAGASLDLMGSFHAATADYLRMGENERFYAVPQADETLSVAAPSAFGFLDSNIAPIKFEGGQIAPPENENDAAVLAVPDGKTVSLAGGDIEMKGVFYQKQVTDYEGNPVFEYALDEYGNWLYDDEGKPVPASDENGNPIPVMETVNLTDIKAPGGRINMAGVASAGEVMPAESDLNVTSQGKGDITITNISADVSGTGGGSVFIRGGQFVADDSIINATTLGEKGGGAIDIQAANLSFKNGAAIYTDTEGSGRGGDLKLNASESAAFSNSFIYLGTSGQDENAGDAGHLLIDAKDIVFNDGAQIYANTYGRGKGGNLTLNASESVSFSNSGIGADTNGSGDGGNVTLNASESVSFSNSNINLTAMGEDENAGSSGTLLIDAEHIVFNDDASISANTYGSGKGGNVTLNAFESVSFSNSNINLTAMGEDENAGDSGTLLIDAKDIQFNDGAEIYANTEGSGKGGDVTLNASELAAFSNSFIYLGTSGQDENAGDAGTFLIDSKDIEFKDDASISANTYGNGKGGNVTLNASESVFFSNSWLYAYTGGSGDGGKVTINALEKVDFSGTDDWGWASKIVTTTSGDGKAGDIEIRAGNISFKDGGGLDAGTSGSGKGGTIEVYAAGSVEMSGVNPHGENQEGFGSGIYARSQGGGNAGDAGNIIIDADSVSVRDGAIISSSTSGTGKGGSITITSDSVTIEGDASGIELQKPLWSQLDFRENNLQFQEEQSSGIYSRTEGKSDAGEAGEIRISASDLTLSRKGKISTSSTGQGQAGRIILDAKNLTIGKNAAIYSAGEAENFHTFSDISERDSRMVIAGDTAEVADIGDGRAVTFFYTGEEWKRLNSNYAVANETERNELSGKYSLLNGDVAEVADAADGAAGSFIYYQEEWIKFDKTSPVATVDNQDELYALDQSSLSIGDVVRIADYGDGKAAELVFTGNFQALNNYTVADMTELNEIPGRYVPDDYAGIDMATKVTVINAGDGKTATFIYNEDGTGETGEWMKLGIAHPLDDFRKAENLTIAQPGDIAQIENAGSFVYTGKEWTELKTVQTVEDIAARNELSPQTGDMVHVRETAKRYIYTEGEWKTAFKSGNAGMIDIVAESVTIEDKGSLSTSNAGQGCAGDIIFIAEKFEMNTGASVSSDSNSKAEGGDAGTITFIGESATLNDSSLSTSSAGTGDAGIITITANAVTLNGNSSLKTSAGGSGNGGDVQIASGSVVFSGKENEADRKDSGIFTNATEKNAGNVFIEAEAVSFTNGSTILSVTFGTGNAGDVFIHADNIEFKNRASVGSTASGDENSLKTGKSGNITLLASESVEFSNGEIVSQAPDEDAGRVLIEGITIRFADGATITTDARGTGKGGDVKILASGRVYITGSNHAGEASTVRSRSLDKSEDAGKAGNILIRAEEIVLENRGEITASTEGPGNAGTITLDASEIKASDASVSSETRSPDKGGDAGIIVISTSGSVTLNNSTLKTSTAGQGSAGAIDMIISDLRLENGASVSSKSASSGTGGDAGKVTIIASDSVTLDSSSLETSSAGKGNAGAINLIISGLQLENGASVSSKSTSAGAGGDAGTITVNAGESVTLHTKSSVKTSSAGEGNAGAINLIVADRLHLDTDTSISSDSESQGKGGDAGTITIIAGELEGDEKTSVSTSSAGEGNAGAINLIVTNLQMGNGASVSSASRSDRKGGDAGTITVIATDSVKVFGTGSLSTDAKDAGGGKISVKAGNSIYLLGGRITSSVKQGEGKGGDITTRSAFVILNNGGITANAEKGDGGAIFIETDNYLRSSDSAVTATSERGNDGTVKIEAPDNDISGELGTLPETFPDATRWMKSPCSGRAGKNTSRFVIRGRDGIANSFDDWQPSTPEWSDEIRDGG
jgi:filamentous hemagglutinin family protein